MSYITNTSTQLILGKLTQYGRERLSKGLLSFKKWSIGDSEINYRVIANQGILTPKDNNPSFVDYIKSGDDNLQELLSDNINTNRIKKINRRDNLNTLSGTTIQWDENVNWDSNILEFNPSCNFNENGIIWEKQNVFTKTIFGVSGHTNDTYLSYDKSSNYLGQKNILFDDSNTQGINLAFDPCNPINESIVLNDSGFTIIYLKYDKVFDYYGEEFFIDSENTFQIKLPEINYHRYKEGEITIFNTNNEIKYLNSNQTPYYDLIEDSTKTNDGKSLIVGRVYPTLLLCVLTDSELLVTMEEKSNRKYTLPKLNADVQVTNNGSEIFLKPNEVVYLTYVINETIHCQYVTKIINNFNLSKKITLTLNDNIKNSVGVINNISVLYQIMDGVESEYELDKWMVIDVTNKLNEDENNIIVKLDSTTKNSSTPYNARVDITDKKIGLNKTLNAIISTSYSTSIFKTNFKLKINSDKFINSTNFSYSYSDVIDESNPNIKVSEVGIYDDKDKMVICGKLSTPFEIKENTLTDIILSIDF